MHRDVMKGIRQFLLSFEQLSKMKITQKSLSDGNILMQFLSILDYKYFDTGQLLKREVQIQKNSNSKRQNKVNNLVLQRSVMNDQTSRYITNNKLQKQLDLLSKLKNWKIIINKIKLYFKQQHDKGIKYSDIDIVDLSRNHSLQQTYKVFQLVLCVVANCGYRQECIQKIMQLQPSTQQTLAQVMQTALQNRLCSIQNQQKTQLIEELNYKEQELSSLYKEIQRLQQINQQLHQEIKQYQQISSQVQYQKQKILLFTKRNPQIQTFNSILDKQPLVSSILVDKQQQQLQQPSFFIHQIDKQQSVLQDSIYLQPSVSQQQLGYNNSSKTNNIVETLKYKLIHQEQAHQQQVSQLQQRIQQLQQQLQQIQYLQQLLLVYQQKYQQALTYVQKVSQYQKQKNKINQEIIQKDLIIQELTNMINELNQRLIQMQQDKIDLQLLVARKNNQKILLKHHKNNTTMTGVDNKSHNNNEHYQSINPPHQLNNLSIKRPQQQKQSQNINKLHQTHNHYQKSQQIYNLYNNSNKLALTTMYPYYVDQQKQPNLEQLKIQIDTLTLNNKRLLRKQKQLTKNNLLLKDKLNKIKHVENQNNKLSHIILELHTRKNQQIEIVLACLYQTYKQFDLKFNKLIRTEHKHKITQKILNTYTLQQNNSKNQQISHHTQYQQKNNKQHKNDINLNQSNSTNFILEDSLQNQISRIYN